MRLFTAIDLQDEVRNQLGSLIRRLRPLAKLSWSPVENLHITTKFVGEWPEEKLGELVHALGKVPKPGPIPIRVGELHWFPNAVNPRVLYAGVAVGRALAMLASATEDALEPLGIEREKRAYSPHLTLARRRNPVPIDRILNEAARLPSLDFGSFEARAFHLFLSASGKYTKLQEFSLCSD